MVKTFNEWRNALVQGGFPDEKIARIETLPFKKLQGPNTAPSLRGVLYEDEEVKCSWFAQDATFEEESDGLTFGFEIWGKKLDKVMTAEKEKLKAAQEDWRKSQATAKP